MSRAPTFAQEHAFLSTVTYASIFEYPLTPEQLHESLIAVRANLEDVTSWYQQSATLQAAIECRDGYFFPRGRGDLVELRQRRERTSRTMLDELRKPLALVLRMPWVRMVALSGSLAHLNASREADLDLFVITRPGRVWSVTTTVLLLARLFGWRRRLCLNYVISQKHLAIAPTDLFSANQIVHLRPLVGTDVYLRFLEANRFVEGYYPNFRPRAEDVGRTGSTQPARLERLLEATIAPLYEACCRRAYGWHLRRRAPSWHSRDQVRLEAECLKLHTSSHRHRVMEHFAAAIEVAERTRARRVAPVHARVDR
jgi:hypothetical protein